MTPLCQGERTFSLITEIRRESIHLFLGQERRRSFLDFRIGRLDGDVFCDVVMQDEEMIVVGARQGILHGPKNA